MYTAQRHANVYMIDMGRNMWRHQDYGWDTAVDSYFCGLVHAIIHRVSEKKSQYTFRYIFSKRGTIITIFGRVRFLGNLLMKQRSNSSPLLLYVSTLPCKTE